MKLTDRELYRLAYCINDYLLTMDAWFTKGDARVFNSLLRKIRKDAEGRKNEKNILKRMGDSVDDE